MVWKVTKIGRNKIGAAFIDKPRLLISNRWDVGQLFQKGVVAEWVTAGETENTVSWKRQDIYWEDNIVIELKWWVTSGNRWPH